MKKLLLRTTALLGLEATGLSDIDSPVEGDGEEAGDGEAAVGKGGLILGLMFMLGLMLGLSGGNDSGEEAGEGVCSMMGPGEGAWAMDITTRERDMASMSVARVNAIVTRGRTKRNRNRTEQWKFCSVMDI